MRNKMQEIMSEDIVISGMSGRFPESNTTDEFAHNLYNKIDLITEDSRRWPTDLYGMNPRMGKLKEIDKFDGLFFGIMDTMGDTIDPQSRILLETTYEAIIDAGINPQSLRGSQTGVYIGYSSFGMPEGIPEETQPDSQYSMTETLLWIPGNSKCLYANRISFVFDFKGPSLLIDTACSSSLVALNTAINDLRLGKCDQAIVGGTQVCLQPFTNHIFQSTHLNSSDGIPKVWDESADGFVRGETVCTLLLQRKSNAKRIYANVLNSGVNIDGNKRMGMFFPSSESQEELMIRTYKEANVDPLEVNYFEAHATGTKVGDTQEAKAIYNAYCKQPNREGKLPIGLLKGTIGHSEGASGLSSVTKVLLVFENQCIPSNLHLKELKTSIAEMSSKLMPINDNMPYIPGIAGVNNFGIGGVNANVLLEPNYKVSEEESLKIAETIPRIINICCRTEEAFNQMCEWIEKNPNKISRDFLALLTDTMKISPEISSTGFPIRGSMFIKKISEDNEGIKYEYKRQSNQFISKTLRQVWFLFPGLGGQWVGMAKALMPIKIFADKIEECHEILKPFGIDLKQLLLSDDPNSMSSMTNKFCATTALEIALFDVMKALNIIPDGIIGHSFGEIACAYADGCLTIKEALLVTYIRGSVTENDKNIPKGLMAVVGLSWNEANKLCPNGVTVVCNNSKETVVVSGIYNETKQMIEELHKKGVFVRELQSHDIPYHSEYLQTCAQIMTSKLKDYITVPKLRSKKWTSTSILDSDSEDILKYASAEYFVHNLISPVFFYNKLKHLPSDAIIVELGPHSLFAKTITQTLESSTYMSLIKKDSNDTNLDMFLGSIAKLYELGLKPDIENLYPKVEWPVARNTQSISSLMKWDHKNSHFVRKFPDYHFRYTSSDLNETIDLSRRFNTFLPDHCIDGNLIFPATGYLMLAWRQLAASRGRIWNQMPIIFEDVQFRRAVFLSDIEVTRLKVKLFDQTGEFVVLERNNLCCCGKIRTTSEDSQHVLSVQKFVPSLEKDCLESEVCLTKDDIYKDLRIGGYDYGPFFRGLQSVRTNNFRSLEGTVEWEGNWIAFTDALLQSMAVGMPLRKMMVPVMIKALRCDPQVLYKAVAEHKVIEEDKDVFNEEKALNDLMDENKDKEYYETETGFMDIDNTNLFEGVVGFRFHIYKSVLPFYANMNTRMIVTHGLEVEDLMAIPIPRKINVQDLKLESYQFMANEDLKAIEDIDRKYLMEYLKVCSTLALKVKKILSINGTNHVNGRNVLSEELVTKYLNDINESHVLLKIFDRLLKVLSIRDENQNIEKNVFNEFINDLKTNPEFDMSLDVINQVSKNEQLIRSLLDIVSENNVPKKEIKVLEINLTNGLMAKEVDNHLASAAIYPIDVNYTIAVKTIDSLHEDFKNKSFKLIEWDYKKTFFPSVTTPLDLIILNYTQEVWDLDIESHLQEVSDMTVSKGFLLTVFRYRLTEPELALNSIQSTNCTKNIDFENKIQVFISEVQKLGFDVICSKSDSISSKALLFRKKALNSPKVNSFIEINSNHQKWFTKLKEKIKFINENEIKDENIWLIANDSSINGILGLINCLRLEPGGEAIRCVFVCDNIIKLPINFNEKPFSDIISNDLAINVLKNGKTGTFRHFTLPKDYDKIESNEYFLNVGQTRDLSSLQWFDYKNITKRIQTFDINNREMDLIHCDIYSSGLNFRDVMLATGRISSGAQHLFTDCVLGLEFSGRRSDTGVRVMGFDMSRCFATSIDANEEFITGIPELWSMDDGVTVLSTYSTVWYGLIERAQLRKNDSILIHSGAGGVGQAAINVCKYYNCDIFVTVGTEDKKKFLMNEYNIPENRIFSSRDIQFKHEIKEITEGKGVDIVLNSLTGDKLEASYECVADCGRFVEIGKYDLQMNKQLGMFSFLRDISFIGVSVDFKLYHNKGFAKRFFDWMHNNCNNGMIKPINRTVFRAEEAEKAFRYMTTGKHIGKIVIKIRDEESDRKPMIAIKPAMSLKTTTKTYFNPNKVYIITGGLGGMGLELVHWMLFLGARKFVLTSRKVVRTKYQKFITKRIQSLGERFKMFGSEIHFYIYDSNANNCKDLLTNAMSFGPIGGVFHLALVLNDCHFVNQTIDKFCETIESKAELFINLDKMSRELNIDLDYFVVFSSIVCGKGNSGQSNYGYANSVCERICEQRRRDGLHGLAIQWGPIDDVGVLADHEIFSSVSGIIKQRINSCFDILDKLLQTSHSVISCYMRAKRVSISSSRESRIVHQIWSSLGIDPNTTPEHLTLGEIGMESMFAVELQQGLERDYQIKVSMNDIKSITIKQLKDFEVGKQEELRKFAEQIRIAREKLNKIKFVITSDPFTRLNSGKTGDPIYLLPPLEGIFASLEALAEKIDRPVIGLNWTKDSHNFGSLKEMTIYYMDLIKTLHPRGDYDIIGHFYGALIAMQMLKKKAPIGRAIIIDILSATKLDDEHMSDDYIIDLVTKFISKDLPQVMKDRLSREIKLKQDLNGKLQKISSEIKEFVGKSLVSKDLDEILKNAFIRAKLFVNYRLNMKKKVKQIKRNIGKKYLEMNGKLLIIKPHELSEDNSNKDIKDQIRDSYFLPEKGLEGRLNFETVDANPDDISIKAFEMMANTINKFLC